MQLKAFEGSEYSEGSEGTKGSEGTVGSVGSEDSEKASLAFNLFWVQPQRKSEEKKSLGNLYIGKSALCASACTSIPPCQNKMIKSKLKTLAKTKPNIYTLYSRKRRRSKGGDYGMFP